MRRGRYVHLYPTETINQITGDFEARLNAVRAERDRYREALEEILRCTDIESAHANANNAIKR